MIKEKIESGITMGDFSLYSTDCSIKELKDILIECLKNEEVKTFINNYKDRKLRTSYYE